MGQYKLLAAAVAAAVGTAAPALAAEDAELRKIREEIRQMREAYEARIQALEQRLQQAESKASRAEKTADEAGVAAAKAETTAAQASRHPATASAFNPEVSLILQGAAVNAKTNPEDARTTGFVPTGAEPYPAKRGLTLGESELVIAGNVDPYFRGVVIAALTPENTVEVEEAYLSTLGLKHGFTFKAGRFYSGIGYLNEIHPHAWDFADAPLAYRAFVGQRYTTDGVQLKWVAPTDLFLEVGAEAGRGHAFPGNDRDKNGFGSGVAFARLGGDIGASTAWRAGVSYVRTGASAREYTDTDSLGASVTNAFTGSNKLWVADFVLKWAPDGNPKYRNFKLQGEYFRARSDGTLAYDDTAGSNLFGGPVAGAFDTRQSGWYLQGVWQFMQGWRTGYRYDRLDSGTVNNGIVTAGLGPTAADFPVLAAYNPYRHSGMLDWSPTEFSRLRLQYNDDRSQSGLANRQWILQYIVSLGAHGAHRF